MSENTSLVIGLTGTFGSGCSEIRRMLRDRHGFEGFILSELIFDEVQRQGKEDPTRKELQDIGNQLRIEHGSGYLAAQAIERAEERAKKKELVFDSIRHPEEVAELRRKYSDDFFLVAVDASAPTRWERVEEDYTRKALAKEDFVKDEERDRAEDIAYGQQVQKCVKMADVILSNEKDFDIPKRQAKLESTILPYLELFMGEKRLPSENEQLMMMASLMALSSTCLKRKVGAVITNEKAIVISSGSNQVPRGQEPCKRRYDKCYRDKLRAENSKWSGSKLLDLCRSLHAEEVAILELSGRRDGKTLHTTTFPCLMCANKIVHVGIEKVVYIEPYPVEISGQLLEESGVEITKFEGVAPFGFYRIFGQ